jgi:hypothetical protein
MNLMLMTGPWILDSLRSAFPTTIKIVVQRKFSNVFEKNANSKLKSIYVQCFQGFLDKICFHSLMSVS